MQIKVTTRDRVARVRLCLLENELRRLIQAHRAGRLVPRQRLAACVRGVLRLDRALDRPDHQSRQAR